MFTLHTILFSAVLNYTDFFSATPFVTDPLEQFDVLPAMLSCLGFTNLSLLLTFNMFIMFVWFAAFNVTIKTNYDFVLNGLYKLVASIVKENLYIQKQQYFTVLFFLFFTILFANLAGMIPYSFTITSSFIVTFFLALMHFIAINHLAAVKHG
jgi:F-type H+-transporting ATPase subunit a